MSFRLLAALSLLIVPLSGCLAGIGTVSAATGLDTATSHADSLVDGDIAPVLMGVGSIEPFKRYYDAEDDFEVNTYADADQGDGKIPGWAYVYCVNQDMVVVFLAAGIGVLADVRDGDECVEDTADEYAVTDWEVDSDEAADILADHEDWPEPQEDSTTFWGLYQFHEDEDTSYPVWEVETGNLDDDPEAFGYARINAQTGEVLYMGGDYPDFNDEVFAEVVEPETESCIETTVDDEASGTIHALRGLTISIDLPEDGYLEMTIQTGVSVTAPQYVLEGPDGEVDSGTASDYHIFGQGVPSGEYTLNVQTDTLAQVEMTLEGTYCG